MYGKLAYLSTFFKVLRLYLEARVWIRTRIKVKARILIRIRTKVTSRIRIRVNGSGEFVICSSATGLSQKFTSLLG